MCVFRLLRQGRDGESLPSVSRCTAFLLGFGGYTGLGPSVRLDVLPLRG